MPGNVDLLPCWTDNSVLQYQDPFYKPVYHDAWPDSVPSLPDNGYQSAYMPHQEGYEYEVPFFPHQEINFLQTDYESSSSSTKSTYVELTPSNGFLFPLTTDEFYPCEPHNEEFVTKTQSRPVRTRKQKEKRTCRVCGDVAKGYNFDAISCEACKAFFRRNAPGGLDNVKCHCGNNAVDVPNRRFCRHCRLKKCFAVGMRKEIILSEEDKAKRREKINRNKLLQHIKEPENAGLCVQETLFTEEDRQSVRDLEEAYDRALTSGSLTPDKIHDKSMPNRLISIAEINIKRIIYMCKKHLSVVPTSDQVALMKGGSMELLILLSVLSYNPAKKQFLDLADKPELHAIAVDQLQQSLKTPDEINPDLLTSFKEHMRFVTSLAVDLAVDKSVVLLLFYIVLFSPDRPGISDKKTVDEQQMKFTNLLQRYLQENLHPDIAKVRFPSLLMRLTELRSLTTEHSRLIMLARGHGILPPLMEEVFESQFRQE